MAPLLCVTYQDIDPLPQIEAGLSTFTDELARTCGSVTRCDLNIGRSPRSTPQGGTWFVRATLHVFGQSIGVVRFQRDLFDGDGLRVAFREILAQAGGALAVISREHLGCGCGGQCLLDRASVTAA